METSTSLQRLSPRAETTRTILLLAIVFLSIASISVQIVDHAAVKRIEAQAHAAANRPAAQINIRTDDFAVSSSLGTIAGMNQKLAQKKIHDKKIRD